MYIPPADCDINEAWGGKQVAVSHLIPSEPMPDLLFVYGSLKKGHKHHYMLGKCTFLGKFETHPNYLLYDTGPYPGMIRVAKGAGRFIEGELYKLSEEQMSTLDKNVPYQFTKKVINLVGREDKAVTHVWNSGVDRFLDCGTRWPRE